MPLDEFNGIVTVLLTLLGAAVAIHAPGKKQVKTRCAYGAGFLLLCAAGIASAIGLSREATKTKNETDAEVAKFKRELQEALVKINELSAQAVTQLTGGDAFPFAVVRVPPLSENGQLNLIVGVNGPVSLTDVSFSMLKGQLPTLDQIRKLPANQAISLLEWRSNSKFVGNLHPGSLEMLPDTIEVAKDSISTYQIAFNANNGMVSETLDVRFSVPLNTWQYRYKVVSERNRDKEKTLVSVDWLPQFRFPSN